MYVELIEFEGGEFKKRHPPFYCKNPYAVFDQTVAKFNGGAKEVHVSIREDNHNLIKAWGNLTPAPSRLFSLRKSQKTR